MASLSGTTFTRRGEALDLKHEIQDAGIRAVTMAPNKIGYVIKVRNPQTGAWQEVTTLIQAQIVAGQIIEGEVVRSETAKTTPHLLLDAARDWVNEHGLSVERVENLPGLREDLEFFRERGNARGQVEYLTAVYGDRPYPR